MRQLTVIFFLSILIPVCFSQQKNVEIKISGTVIDNDLSQPMEQATVKLLSLPDSALITGTVSGTAGTFALATNHLGKTLLSVSFVGYETAYRELTLSASRINVEVGKILLSPSSLILGEAIVQGKAPDVVVKVDTTEYNASSYKLQANSMLEELLKKLPGVEVDSDGNITVGGKSIDKILVDGKEFFGSDTKVATKNLNVDIIDKLQVIDRKTDEARKTGVDDGEEEKVINLTVKPGMKKGWFGNGSAAYGNKDRYDVNGMVNRFVGDNQFSVLGALNNTNNVGFSMQSPTFSGFSSGKGGEGITSSGNLGTNFNLYDKSGSRLGGDFLFGGSNEQVATHTERENLLQDSSTYYNEYYDSRNRNRNFKGNLTLEWKIDSLTRFEMYPSIGYSKNRGSNQSVYTTTDSEQFRINEGVSDNVTDGHGVNYSVRSTLIRESGRKKGRKLSITFSFSGENNNGTNYYTSHTIYGDSLLDIASVRDTSIHQKQSEHTSRNGFRVRTTYVEPFGNNRFLQFAYSMNTNINESERYSYNWLEDEEAYAADFDSLYSDHFRNTTLSQRIGVNVRTIREKYNYTVGVNVDPSHSKSVNYLDDDRSYSRSVVNFGPALDFTYMWNKRKNLRLQYRGNTQQPSISQLQPSKNISNPLIVREGNLNLDPSYNNYVTLRYNKYEPEKQRLLTASLNGNLVVNSIVNQTTYDRETGIQTTKPVNVNGVWNLNGNFFINTPLKNKKFTVSSFSNTGFNQRIGFSDGQKNRSRTVSFSENGSVTYRRDEFDVELRGNYSVARTDNTISKRSDQTTMSYGGTVNLGLNLPKDINLRSDFSYRGNSGYSASFQRTELIWNAHMNWAFLKNKQATLFCKMYDILQQRSNVRRSVTGNYIEDIQTNLLTDYFLIGFSYQFNTMGGKKGKAGSEEIRGSGRPRPSNRGGRGRDIGY